jgi:hypothetical protein
MAKDWQEYVEIQAFETASDNGGFFTPEEQYEEEVTQILPPPRWGSLRGAVADIPRPDAEEEKLLAEDFNDDDEPRRGAATS